MDLYIYDPDINQLGVIDGYSSLRWRRRFFEPGEVELHCPATAENLALLQEENIIHRLDRQEAAIVEGVSVATTDSGDEITATGRMGSSMLDQRIITPTINFSGTVEDAMRKIVSDNAITARPLPHLALGGAAGLTPTCTFQATGKSALAVCTALAKAAPLGFRARMDVPGKRWVFEAYDGVDRSVTQHDRPYVLFSDEFRNITGPEYTLNTVGYANYAYVAGQDSGQNRVIVEVDQRTKGDNLISGDPKYWESGHYALTDGAKADVSTRIRLKDLIKVDPSTTYYFNTHNSAYYFVIRSYDSNRAFVSSWGGVGSVLTRTTTQNEYYLGIAIYNSGEPGTDTYDGYIARLQNGTIKPLMCRLERRELWVDARDLQQAEGQSIDDYRAQLAQRGLEKLAEVAKAENFAATAVDTANFRYLEDWDLGDIVSFERWGIRIDQRITEVEEVYEGGVTTITPVCGNPLPETLDLGSDT